MTCGRGYECSPTGGGCGEHFGSLAAFDRHLLGEQRRCLSVARMQHDGFRPKANGLWSIRSRMAAGDQVVLRATAAANERADSTVPLGAVADEGASPGPRGQTGVPEAGLGPRGDNFSMEGQP